MILVHVVPLLILPMTSLSYDTDVNNNIKVIMGIIEDIEVI